MNLLVFNASHNVQSLGNESTLSSKEEKESETSVYSLHLSMVGPSKNSNGNEKDPNQVVPVQSDATISPVSVNMLATTITPFSIFVKVTVSSPSFVWCGVKDSSTSQASASYLRSYGSAVTGILVVIDSSTDAKTFAIARLQPNTNYPLLCATIPIDSTNDKDVHSRTQNMMTGDGTNHAPSLKDSYLSIDWNSSNASPSDLSYFIKRGCHVCVLSNDTKT